MQFIKNKRKKLGLTLLLLFSLFIGLSTVQPFLLDNSIVHVSAKEVEYDETEATTPNPVAGAKEELKRTNKSKAGIYDSNMDVDWNLSADPTFSDLYASIIFSNGKDGVANETQLSFEEIKKYGQSSSSSDNGVQLYGNIDMGNNETSNGRQLANYLYTINKSKWIHTIDKQDVLGEKVFEDIVGGGGDVVARIALNTASFGAQLWDASTSMILSFGRYMQKLDIPHLFGLTAGSGGQNQNFIQVILEKMFSRFGVTPQAITLIRNVSMTMIIIGALIGIIIQIGRLNVNGALKLLSRLFLRAFTIWMTLSITTGLQDGINALTSMATNNFMAAESFNNQYVVNSLDWAITENLSLDSINASSADIFRNNNAKDAASQFKPSQENIAKLNSNIESKLNAAGLLDTKQSAVSMLDGLANGEIVSVNDYLIGISQANSAAIKSSNGPQPGQSISAGEFYSRTAYTNIFPNKVYFLSSNSKKQEEVSSAQLDAAFALLNKSTHNDEAISSVEGDASTLNDYYKIYTFGSGSAVVQIPYSPSNSSLKMQRVSWKKPSTYIYGAGGDNSSASGDYNNYINGSGTTQNNDPISGKDSYIIPAQKNAMYTNSLAIALMNRWGGVSDKSKDLSTQSVAFILQTALSDKGAVYQGYNTTYTDTDKGKPSAKDGAVFAKYTIPHTNAGDWFAKVGAINMTWLLAGVCSVLALLTLLKAPMFSATFKMIMSFMRALFTGNIIALLQYAAYYAAIQMSFGFALIAAYMATQIGSLLTDYLGVIANINNFLSFDPLSFGSATAAAVDAPIVLPSLGTLLIAALMTYLMSWPIFSIKTGSRNREKKVGLVEVMVTIPYLMAEAFDEYVDVFERVLYGRAHNQNFLTKLGRRVNTIDQKKQIRDKAVGALKTAGQIGAAVMTGGTSAIAGAGAKIAAGKALSGLMGSSTNVEDQYADTENDTRSGGIAGMLKKIPGGDKLSETFGNHKAGSELLDNYDELQNEKQQEFDDAINRELGIYKDPSTKPEDQLPINFPKDIIDNDIDGNKDENNINDVDDLHVNKANIDTNEPLTAELNEKEINANIISDDVKQAELEDKKFGNNDNASNTKDQNLLQAVHDELVDVESAIKDQDGMIVDGRGIGKEFAEHVAQSPIEQAVDKQVIADSSTENATTENETTENSTDEKSGTISGSYDERLKAELQERRAQQNEEFLEKARNDKKFQAYDHYYKKAESNANAVATELDKEIKLYESRTGKSYNFDDPNRNKVQGIENLSAQLQALNATRLDLQDKRNGRFIEITNAIRNNDPAIKAEKRKELLANRPGEAIKTTVNKVVEKSTIEKTVKSTVPGALTNGAINAGRVGSGLVNTGSAYANDKDLTLAKALRQELSGVGKDIAKDVKAGMKVVKTASKPLGGLALGTMNNLMGLTGSDRITMDEIRPDAPGDRARNARLADKSAQQVSEKLDALIDAIGENTSVTEDALDGVAYDLRNS